VIVLHSNPSQKASLNLGHELLSDFSSPDLLAFILRRAFLRASLSLTGFKARAPLYNSAIIKDLFCKSKLHIIIDIM
jgi:hypothetical protein